MESDSLEIVMVGELVGLDTVHQLKYMKGVIELEGLVTD